MKYRKKPIIIEAFCYNIDPRPDWFMDKVSSNEITTHTGWIGQPSFCFIKTFEGIMTCEMGDYIIKGVKGEIYPCKKDIFEMTYEAIDE